MQHSTLVAMGVRWLGRQCSVVLYEFATPADENPDVIGWVAGAGSVLIECKLSRADFLKDAAKPVRKNSAHGNGAAPLLSLPARCDSGEGSSTQVGTAVGHERPGDRAARGARTSGEKPYRRSPLSQRDAEARANQNRHSATVGMAEGRKSLRGKARHLPDQRTRQAQIENQHAVFEQGFGLARIFHKHALYRRIFLE